jgi:cardiolipin synthase
VIIVRLAQLPNTITILRLVMVPVLVALLHFGNFRAAFWLFLLAGLSDGLDGFLARRYGLQSHLGGILDPVADKVLMVSMYITLSVLHLIPLWVLLVVISRDFLIVGGYLVYTSHRGAVRMQPSVFSKINTAFQIALLVAVLASGARYILVPFLVDILMYSVVVTTVVSGAHYYWLWVLRAGIEAADPEDDDRTR